MTVQILDPDNYSLTIHAASSLAVGLAIGALGVSVVIRERASRISLIFLLFSACIALWLAGFSATYASQVKQHALIWTRAAQVGVTFIHATILILVFAVVQRLHVSKWSISGALGLSSLFCMGAFHSDLFVRDVERHFWGYYPRYGALGVLFIVYFFVVMLSVLRLIRLEYKTSSNERHRKRLKGLFLGFSLGYVGSADFLAALGVPLYPFGHFAMIPFLVVIARVITRYRLVDITPELAAAKILETMQGAVVVVDLDNRVQLVNPVARRLFECGQEEIVGRNFLSLLELPPDLHACLHRGDGIRNQEVVWPNRSGKHSVVSLSASVFTDRNEEPAGVVFVAHDITERKQAEQDLKRRNAFIETILNNLPIGLSVNSSANGETIYLNDKFCEIYGWPRAVFTDVEQFFLHIYPDPARRREMQERILSDIASGDPARMRWENIAVAGQAGSTKYVTAVNIPLPDQDIMISTVQDVTERVRAEQDLAESENRFRRLVESATDYIYTVRIEQGRPAGMLHGHGCLPVTGYGPAEFGMDPGLWHRIIHSGDRPAVSEHEAKVLSGCPADPLEHRIIHKDGTVRWVRNTVVPRYAPDGRVIEYEGLITDITPLKKLEAQLRQSQKMEAVGQLAGGIAHDFNNILTAIVGYSNLLLMKLPEREAEGAYARHILASAERAAHLTHSLLAFSRKQLIELQPVDVNRIITKVEKLLIRIIGEDILFKTVLAQEDLPVLVDSVQIEQVLMNFATNARDAMPQGGLLTIETGRFEMNEEFLKVHGYGKPGAFARIIVSDTGIGIEEKVRVKIFEPFFTTKEVGKGTGLGLAMVYGIIKQHGGYINVYSEPGQGTVFKIYLPLTDRLPPAEEKTSDCPAQRGTETILLAEDDKSVRRLMQEVLEKFGYKVIEAVDGEDAVLKFEENRKIDLVVSDMIMPRKNGSEMYQEIKKLKPSIKVLFISGYTADIAKRKGVLEPRLDFLLKPISPREFLMKVREVLDRGILSGEVQP